jgi:hypothetical protein
MARPQPVGVTALRWTPPFRELHDADVFEPRGEVGQWRPLPDPVNVYTVRLGLVLM